METVGYLCDLCCFAHPKNGWLLIPRCFAQNGVYVVNKPIDYGEQDPHKVCVYFKRKKHRMDDTIKAVKHANSRR